MLNAVEKKGYNKSAKFRLGLNGKLLTGIVIPLIVILFILAAIVITKVVSVVSTVKRNNIENQIYAATTQTQSYFEKFFITEDFLRDRRNISYILRQADMSSTFRFEQDPRLFNEVVRDLSYAHSLFGNEVESVWLASVNNQQLMQSNGTYIDNFQVHERVWYKMLASSPEKKTILSPAYISTNDDQVIVTVATAFRDDTGNMIGVIGIDILMEELSKYLQTIEIGTDGYITVYDSNQNIIYHPNSETLMMNLSEIDYSENMKSALQNHQQPGFTKYERSGETFYGNISYLDEWGWAVLGCMPGKEYNQEIKSIIFVLGIGFLICIIILTIICCYQSKKMVSPLRILNSAAQEFAKGNLDDVITKTTNDEVGDLTDVFIQTQSNLKEMISDIGYVIQEISDKNLTAKPTAHYQGAFVQIEQSLQSFTQKMNGVLHLINDTADQVDMGANQVASGSQSLAQGSTEQASSVEELASNINNISNQMQKMSQHAQAASDKANHVGNDVQQSSDKMKLMVEAMERIDKSSNEIQKIIKAIEDIAFQTNILSLNAAVEASRAGAAGKGFAVVADEVRNLAGKSAEASKTTATLISNSLSAVKDGMLLAKEANDSLVLAVTDVQSVAENIQDVSNTLQSHVETMERLTLGMDQISSVVQTNSATSEQSAAASQELSARANDLKKMMSEFKFDI